MREENTGYILGPHAGSVDSIEGASSGIEEKQGGRGLDQSSGAGALCPLRAQIKIHLIGTGGPELTPARDWR
jgi:hypothetical protein